MGKKNINNVYGYIRVSSIDQNIERQLLPLIQLGIPRNHIFIDKVSGKDFNRPNYQKLRKKLKPGDLLYIKSIDRLGRNYEEIIEEWRYLTKERNIDICILDMQILDTRLNKDLLGTFIADIVLYLLSYVAQQERDFNKVRQSEGIAAARLRGVMLGRKPAPLPPDFEYIYNLYISQAITVSEALTSLGCTRNKFYYLIRKYKNLNQIK